MSFWEDFKQFINRGNVVDMAVGIVVGSSFVKIVDSLVSHLINPVLGFLIGGIDLTGFRLTGPKGASIEYGTFLNSIIDFLIIAFSVFVCVRAIQLLRRNEEIQQQEKKCSYCCMKIAKQATKCPYCTSKLS